jgi:hypothetical protein
MHGNSVMVVRRPLLAPWIVRCDDYRFVSGTVQMLENAKHRVRNPVDVGQERFCDDRNSHTDIVSRGPDRKVACGNTTRKIREPENAYRNVTEITEDSGSVGPELVLSNRTRGQWLTLGMIQNARLHCAAN